MTDPKAVARWRRQANKGTKQRKAAVEAGTSTLALTEDEVKALAVAREARVRQYAASYGRDPRPPAGSPSARELARRLNPGWRPSG